ncbi:MAG: 16S rRNA (cytosine(1402)-N(4))-methyltransferase RsmH [Elusimicrobia bacterium]|nr:16S rRNA (cytosine(1402)-N(4))-methyltransferase RsmH [Elusimicrobiota bacterium]
MVGNREVIHRPVLLKEVVENLVTDPKGRYLDATVGEGGHSVEISRKLSPGGELLAMDWDPGMIALARERIGSPRVRFLQANFKDLKQTLDREKGKLFTGIIFDLGISSYHYEREERGFSFYSATSLDMRINPQIGISAGQIVNEWPLDQLVDIFRKFGEEKRAVPIARAIVERRKVRPISSGVDLSLLIENCVGRKRAGVHPATKVFMALRIVVNRELDNLTDGLEGILSWVKSGGRVGVISFHSLEDRIVKHIFRAWVKTGEWQWVFRTPLQASAQEIQCNPRSRSAKFRVVERI